MYRSKYLCELLACGALVLAACVTDTDPVGAKREGLETHPGDCRPGQGLFDFEQTTPDQCDADLCYEGELTHAGFLNGEVSLGIEDIVPLAGLPLTSGARGSYSGESTITTPQGTLTLRHVGIFVFPKLPPDPTDEVIQSDVSVIIDGTGRFSSASGQFFNTGFAVPGAALTDPVVSTSGESHGTLCLRE